MRKNLVKAMILNYEIYSINENSMGDFPSMLFYFLFQPIIIRLIYNKYPTISIYNWKRDLQGDIIFIGAKDIQN
ncbi:hypothetical protein C3E88_06290 [Clostridium sp. Cult3]|nr:hypothetical protein [Clostridium sp. Cult3]